jgi:hypothetical protein
MNRLDVIIDALEDAVHNFAGDDTEEKCIEALAAARELRGLKPVAWAAKSIYGDFEGLSFDKQPRFDTPLYALEMKK